MKVLSAYHSGVLGLQFPIVFLVENDLASCKILSNEGSSIVAFQNLSLIRNWDPLDPRNVIKMCKYFDHNFHQRLLSKSFINISFLLSIQPNVSCTNYYIIFKLQTMLFNPLLTKPFSVTRLPRCVVKTPLRYS